MGLLPDCQWYLIIVLVTVCVLFEKFETESFQLFSNPLKFTKSEKITASDFTDISAWVQTTESLREIFWKVCLMGKLI